MYKSGLIFGAVMFVGALVITFFVAFCVPCLAVFIGLAAGYVAAVFMKPLEQPTAVRSGAIAGAIAGIGAILGEMVGSIINGVAVGPNGAAQLFQQFGLSTGAHISAGEYWAILLGENFCIALFSVALMAGLGALGGLIWWSMSGKNKLVPPVPPPPPAF